MTEKRKVIQVVGYGPGNAYPRLHLPKDFTDALGIRPGDYVVVEVRGSELVIRKVQV